MIWVDADAGWLGAIGGADIALGLVLALDGRGAAPFGAGGRVQIWTVEIVVLGADILLFSLTTLPAISPITNKEFKAEGVDFHARLEADAEVAEIHLVFLGVGEEEGEVAGDGEEEVIVEGGEGGELVD